MEPSLSASEAYGALRAAWGWAVSRVNPEVVFGCPIQKSKTPGHSWWYVPITIRRRLLSVRGLPRCEVSLRLYQGTMHREDIELRWHRKETREGLSVVDLWRGKWELVPVVFREEGDDHNAYITDSSFMDNNTMRKYVIAPKQGKCRLRLTVHSGSYAEQSHWFMIRNHDFDSNGHFTLETVYEGRGMDAHVE